MRVHPLKFVSLLSWLALFAAQLALAWPGFGISLYWPLLAASPLLLPLAGLWRGRLYTYRWVGFVALFYFCLGIAELVANPALRGYAYATTIASIGLFFGSIYYARYLGTVGD